MGLGEILDGAVQFIRAHPAVVLGASAIVAVISQIVQVPLVYAATRDAADLARGGVTDLGQLTGVAAGAATGGAAGSVVTGIATVVLTGLLMVVLSRSVLGAPVDAGECWRAARPRLLGLFGVVILASLVVIAVLLLAAVPGALALALGSQGLAVALFVLVGLAGIVMAVFVGVRLSLASPSFVLEDVGVTEALRRSWFLVTGRWWPVFGIQLLAGLIAGVLSAIISVPFGLLSGAIAGQELVPGLLALTISGLGTIVALTLTAPFQAGVTGLLYVDQRMRREGFDIQLQQAVAGSPG